jgi:cytoskeletal protein CcmA (bactofilin family)
MFSKQDKPGRMALSSDLAVLSEPSAPPRRSGPKAPSLFSEDITIKGDLRGDGELQVDGAICGDVTVARLIVGESGRIEGLVHAEQVDVRGRVVGAITAKQVRLYASAHIEGDITHEQLTMEAGAFFQGRSLRLQRAAAPMAAGGDVIELNPAPEPLNITPEPEPEGEAAAFRVPLKSR